MDIQEEQKSPDNKPADQGAPRPDTDQKSTGHVNEDERSIPSDKKINLSDEDQALDSGI